MILREAFLFIAALVIGAFILIGYYHDKHPAQKPTETTTQPVPIPAPESAPIPPEGS